MEFTFVSSFTATDLKAPGPVLDAATRGPVRVTRRGQSFVLMREEQLAEIVADAADPRPKTLADLVVDYGAEDVKKRLGGWLRDPPVGKEIF
jgi:hypothetical protein